MISFEINIFTVFTALFSLYQQDCHPLPTNCPALLQMGTMLSLSRSIRDITSLDTSTTHKEYMHMPKESQRKPCSDKDYIFSDRQLQISFKISQVVSFLFFFFSCNVHKLNKIYVLHEELWWNLDMLWYTSSNLLQGFPNFKVLSWFIINIFCVLRNTNTSLLVPEAVSQQLIAKRTKTKWALFHTIVIHSSKTKTHLPSC